jgi:hypothetical protein
MLASLALRLLRCLEYSSDAPTASASHLCVHRTNTEYIIYSYPNKQR